MAIKKIYVEVDLYKREWGVFSRRDDKKRREKKRKKRKKRGIKKKKRKGAEALKLILPYLLLFLITMYLLFISLTSKRVRTQEKGKTFFLFEARYDFLISTEHYPLAHEMKN